MHTWLRRGLRTALVTGGLLMLGTSIASADENVSPDLPPSPVDAGVSVPFNAGHIPLSAPTYRDVGEAAGRKVATPALPAAPAPVGSVVSRVNPLIRQAQAHAQRVIAQKVTAQKVGDRPAGDRDTLSGTLTAAQMAIPMRTTSDAVTGLGAVPARPASRTRSALRANNIANSHGSNATMSGPAGVLPVDNPVVHNGSLVVPDSVTLPIGASRTMGNSPMAQRLPSMPHNGVLSGAPVVPSLQGVGLFDGPQVQSAPASLGALPSAPTASSVGNVVRGVSSRLPVRYQAEAPTSAVPIRQSVQSTQVLNKSPFGSLTGLLPVEGLLGQVVTQPQHEVPASAMQSLDARSIDLPPNGPLPGVPTVGQIEDRATSVPVTDAVRLSAAQVQSLDTSPVGQLPDVPMSPAPVLGDAATALSHTQIHPVEAPTSAMRPVQALNDSPLGARPSVPEVPSVPDVSSAPTAQSVMDTVPVTQAAVVPSAVASTTALPSPIADLVQPLGSTTLGALPGVPMSEDGVGSLLSQLPVSRLAEAPSSARPGPAQSPLPTVPLLSGLLGNLPGNASSALPVAQAAEVPTSVPSLPSLGQATDALPGVPSLPQAQGVVDQVAAQVPVLQAAVQPVSSVSSWTMTPSAQQSVLMAGTSVLGSLPGDPSAAVANSAPQVAEVPSSVRSSVNNSPIGALPGTPQVPSVPSVGSLVGDAADVASSPTHVTRMTELPVSDVNTSNLPSAPVGSVSYSPTGRMFGVPTVREAATRSLAAVPVEQMAQVPGTVSHSVNESPIASLPGGPRVPSVPAVPDLAVRTASQPPVSYVTGAPASAAHATQVFGRPSDALPGVSDADGVAGVLPVVQDLFPRI